MNKNKLLSNLLKTLEKLENSSKIINKKLNTNRLSKSIESIFKSKDRVIDFLNFRKNIKKVKSLFKKELNLPEFLTTDNLLQAIKKIIKNRSNITSQLKKEKRIIKKDKANKKSQFNLFNKINSKLISNKKTIKSVIETFTLSLKNITALKINNPLISQQIKLDKESHNIAAAVYNEHCLTLASVIINKNNKIFIKGVIEVPIPGDVIGDSCVEDKEELSNIILDLLTLLKLENSPILIILSSSLFKINTFSSSELKQISNTDDKVQSKSPYLPNDTFVEFRNMSGKNEKNKLIRTVYTSRKLIESWTDTLGLLSNPIVGITASAPNIFDIIKNKIQSKISILIDIEKTNTNVIIGRDSISIASHKLPYGSSLYSSEEEENKDLSENYFSRLLASLDLIMSEYEEELPLYIYSYGKGLDDLVKNNESLPTKFKRLSEIKLIDFSYTPNQMQTHELFSKSIDSTIETLSLITSCL